MSKQVSLFMFFGGSVPNRINVSNRNNSGTSRSQDMEDIVLRDVKMPMKDVVHNVASAETCKKKAVSDESYSALKLNNWKSKFVFWDTKDGQVNHISNFLFLI